MKTLVSLIIGLIMLIAVPVWGINTVQSISAQGQLINSLTTADLTTTSGNLITCDGSYNLDNGENVQAFNSLHDSKSNTWSTAIAETPASGDVNSAVQERYVANATGGANHNFTIDFTSIGVAGVALACREVAGAATSGVLDRIAIVANNTGTSYSSGSTATTTQADELLAGGCAVPASAFQTDFTATGSWVEDEEQQHLPGTDISVGIMIASYVVSATGAYAMTCNISASTGSGGIAWISTWKAVGAAPGVARRRIINP